VNVSLSKYQKQAGVALITVMLIVALCAVIASQMTARMQMQVQRSANVTFNQQAYWYAMGAEAFAKRVLITAFNKKSDVTHLDQVWAQGKTTYPVDFGDISGEIIDLQSCLNLNALRAPLTTPASSPPTANNNKVPARLAFEVLLGSIELEENISQFEIDSMADALTDWLDENSHITGSGGAEDDDYASREFPYLAANNFLASVNELRVVTHFTPAIINGIKPYVCIIPASDQHKININTLSTEQPELLQALLNSTLEEAEQILTARPDEGFETIEDFHNLNEVTQLNLTDKIKEQFVVDSEYFTLKASASFNNSFFAMNSVMKVTNNKEIDVISRTIGRN
jgi:general secretion pathway protein K